MSGPSIPNILETLRAGRPSQTRRGRGQGNDRYASTISHDGTVQGTDTDAAVSRLSAVDLGYLEDPYARYFVQSADGPPPRRLPIINRGTYTRTRALDILVESFLAQDGFEEKQIVSLGAGTDTRPFRLYAQSTPGRLIYHELDFEVTCSKKLQTVQNTPLLRNILGDITKKESRPLWYSKPSTGGEYYCHGLDLRALTRPSVKPRQPISDEEDEDEEEEYTDESAKPLQVGLPGLRTDIPTLILSECCLCYLSPPEASAVLAYFTARIPNLATVIYEPIKPDDPFGRVMVSNLAARRIHMPTLTVFREPADQEARLLVAGFGRAQQMTVEDIWDTWVGSEEKQRVDSLEGLDEVEEWKLLAGHYIVVWGSRGDGFTHWGSRDGVA